MQIVFVEIRNFRGIKNLDWSPMPGMNCLIGAGDSTKTTVLDAIELALIPRAQYLGDDTDFHELNFSKPATVTLTLTGFPAEFCADTKYGLHLRGWNPSAELVADEPGDGLVEALSVRLEIDPASLEGRWSIFNDRIAGHDSEPPYLRYKDARLIAPTRLGPYAERHLSWSRQSALNRISESTGIGSTLVEATRAARNVFRESNRDAFAEASTRAETLSKLFSVPVRDKFTAELDMRGSQIGAGGVSLHDANLPLRTLGSGSSRLIVAALQHNADEYSIALVDEIEHGLEPHRIARLLKQLSSGPRAEGQASRQVFVTTHSPVVLRELDAADIHAVRSLNGETTVNRIISATRKFDDAQRHLRTTPDAFLARSVVVGEGKTECGLARGLDACWSMAGNKSFALQGAVAISGDGMPSALTVSEHLLDLGYAVLTILDSDEMPTEKRVAAIRAKGGKVLIWQGECSTEQRILLDVPWATVKKLVAYAADECSTPDEVLKRINKACEELGIMPLSGLLLPDSLDTKDFRAVLGLAAKSRPDDDGRDRKHRSWFKDIGRGERVGELVYECLGEIRQTPLGIDLAQLRSWVDG